MSRAQTSASARFCGRDFSPGELERIRAIIVQGQVCRSQLARQVCQEFAWLNAQGRLKEMSCKVALLRMERAGLLVLPPPRARNGNGKKQLLTKNLLAFEQTPLTLPAHQLHPLSLVIARTRPERLLYRQIMVQHHHLGYCPMAGAQLRYLLFNGSRLLGGLGFGASAWSLADRDRLIGWSSTPTSAQSALGAQQSPLSAAALGALPNLASRVLGLVCRRLVLPLWLPTRPTGNLRPATALYRHGLSRRHRRKGVTRLPNWA
jgi:hypothetical protein